MRFKCVTHDIPFMRPINFHPINFALRVLRVLQVKHGLRQTHLHLIEVMQAVMKVVRFVAPALFLSMIFVLNLMRLVRLITY